MGHSLCQCCDPDTLFKPSGPVKCLDHVLEPSYPLATHGFRRRRVGSCAAGRTRGGKGVFDCCDD